MNQKQGLSIFLAVIMIFSNILIAVPILKKRAQAAPVSTTEVTATTRAIVPSNDTYAEEGDSTPKPVEKQLLLKGSDKQKQAFLSFDIKRADPLEMFGEITSAKLRLYFTGSEPVNVSVFSADNGWNQEGLTWTKKPESRESKPLTNGTSAQGWVEFNVTNYVTAGLGTYSFNIRTDSAAETVISSSRGSFAPELLITYKNTYFETQNENALIAPGYFDRLQDKNEAAQGILDATKGPYFADPTGKTDSTLAIQRAINEAREARLVCYLPAGNYLVSSTITMNQVGFKGSGNFDGSNDDKWLAYEMPCVLVGPSGGSRAVLKLKSNAADFSDENDPLPVLYVYAVSSQNENNSNLKQPNISFNNKIRDIDIDLNNNPGSIGVHFQAAQGSTVEDVTVYAKGAFAGMERGIGSGGAVYNLKVLGGKYGVYMYKKSRIDIQNTGSYAQPSPLLSGCTFIGQTENSVYAVPRGPLTIVGAKIEGKGIRMDDPGNEFNGALNLIDSTIQLDKEGTTIQAERSVYLSNVYLFNASTAVNIQNGRHVLYGAGDDWCLVKEYAAGMQWSPPVSDDPAQIMPVPRADQIWVDGEKKAGAYREEYLINPSFKPMTDFQKLHTWTETPMWNQPGVINVKNAPFNAKGDNSTDDWPAIQLAIMTARLNGYNKVFLPKGQYRISRPLELQGDTRLFGISNMYTVILPIETSSFYNNPAQPNPLIKTIDDPEGTAMLYSLKLLPPSDAAGVYAINWRVGRNSMYRSVDIRRFPKEEREGDPVEGPVVLIEGSGGGRWFNLHSEIDEKNCEKNTRLVKVNGTAEPLAFYMLDLEDFDSDYMTEFNGASNIEIYAAKCEGRFPFALFKDCNNVRIFGAGGLMIPAGLEYFRFENSQNYLAVNIDPQTQTRGTWDNITEIYDGNTLKTGSDAQLLLFKRGNPVSALKPIAAEKITAGKYEEDLTGYIKGLKLPEKEEKDILSFIKKMYKKLFRKLDK